jgi:hypothetical protein
VRKGGTASSLLWGKMIKFLTLFIIICIILMIWKLESVSPPHKKPEMYPYKKIILFYSYFLIISVAASLIVYFFTEALGVTLTMFGCLAAFVIGGGIKSLYSEYRKRNM